KGFHHTDASKRVLYLCIDIGNALPASLERAIQLFREVKREHSQDRQEEKDRQGQFDVDVDQNDKGADELDRVDQVVLRRVMIELCQGEQIVGQAGHELPGPLVVEETERELLVMVEELAAHVAFHHGAHRV